MKKYVIRIAVAFLTFSLGILFGGLIVSRHSSPEESSLPPVAIPPELANKPVNKAWRRIEVGHVSFYIPPHLKKTGPPGNVGVVDAFGGPRVGQEDFYLYYSYWQKIDSDFNVPAGRSSDLIIDGKPAKLYIIEIDERMMMSWNDRSTMQLVVPDVGDGRTTFKIYAAGFDLDLMRQIIESVQIR